LWSAQREEIFVGKIAIKIMNQKIKITFQQAILFCVLTFLSGCASNIGNRNITDVGRFLNLEKNKSSKADVYKEFGQPHDVEYTPGDSGSFWTYYFTKTTMNGATFVPFVGLVAGGLNTDTTVTDFFFDQKGAYVKVGSSNKAKYVNSWVGLAKSAHELSTDKKAERVKVEMEKLKLPFDQKIANSVKDIGAVADKN